MRFPHSSDQDKGLAHCHYIRQLAHEIWLKENERPGGIVKVKFDECIRRALLLHRKKLMKNQVDRIMATAPKTPPGATPMPPVRRILLPNHRLN